MRFCHLSIIAVDYDYPSTKFYCYVTHGPLQLWIFWKNFCKLSAAVRFICAINFSNAAFLVDQHTYLAHFHFVRLSSKKLFYILSNCHQIHVLVYYFLFKTFEISEKKNSVCFLPGFGHFWLWPRSQNFFTASKTA